MMATLSHFKESTLQTKLFIVIIVMLIPSEAKER